MTNHPKRSRRGPCVQARVEDIRRAQARAGLTNAQCAELLCVPERTYENWVADESTPNYRPMPKGAWKLLRYELGMLDPPRKKR